VHGWFRGKEWEELDWAQTEPGSEQKVSQPEHEGEKKKLFAQKVIVETKPAIYPPGNSTFDHTIRKSLRTNNRP
jgi:hypothetical protein